jgi:pyruvate formate lyase activating enzyme
VILGGLQKTTLLDFPGKIAATVFICGCNFRCPWCYNPELVLPKRIKSQPKIPEKYFFDFLKKRKGLLEGVCITGGEPTLNRDLPKFVKKIKKLGYLVKLDTNGSEPEMLKKLITENLLDYLAMDIKAPLGLNFQLPTSNFKLNSNSQISKYQKATGVKINREKIKKSIEIIKNSDIEYEFRTTIVPTIQKKEDILEIAREISPAKRYILQNFRPEKTIDPKFEKIKPYSKEYLVKIQKAIFSHFEVCQIR